jgi:HD-like signal output (HDOD) protein
VLTTRDRATALAEPGDDARTLVCRLPPLPALPEALREALHALRHDQAAPQRCITLIERDQALAAATLRVANSAFFGLPGRVQRVADAVQLLGLRSVAGVLAACSLQAPLPSRGPAAFDIERHWRHALLSAAAARRLAPLASLDADLAYLAGLLANIGALVQAVLVHQGGDDGPGLDLDPERLAAALLAHWQFPPELVAAFAPGRDGPDSANAPASADRSLRQVMHAASALAAQALAAPPATAQAESNLPAALLCGLPADQACDLLADLAQMAVDLQSF